MRMKLKSVTAGAFVSLVTLLILGASNIGLADVISDTVTVKDTLGKIDKTLTITEAQEPVSMSLDIPQTVIPIGANENNAAPKESDTLTIAPFSVVLLSDKDQPGADTGELRTTSIKISVKSDMDTPSGVSDILTVNGVSKNIAENAEPGSVTIEGRADSLRIRANEGGPSMPSDIVTVVFPDITLFSDKDLPGADVGESLDDTITITVRSDVPAPEPGTLLLLAVGLLGLGLIRRRKAV